MEREKKLVIGCDHAGYALKVRLTKYLENKGYSLKDVGTNSEDRVDYPDFGHALASTIIEEEVKFGLLMCGTGNGINMSVNKHAGIRAALCWNPEVAKLARQHNNANVISLPARLITFEDATQIVDAFLNNSFEGGRHEARVNKIDC